MLEGGSIHVDGQGTVLTTEMCLLSPGRNPELSRRDIEEKLCDYLGCEKVIWLRDGIDPDETNGHIDDVACFVAPGEVACIWTEDPENPFYQAAQDAFRALSQATDAKGRRLTVHKLCLTKSPAIWRGRRPSTPWRAPPPGKRRGQHRLVYELSHRQRGRYRPPVR